MNLISLQISLYVVLFIVLWKAVIRPFIGPSGVLIHTDGLRDDSLHEALLKKTFKIIKNFQPEIVIHMAALPLVRESYSKPVETFETNVLGTVNILDSLRHIDNVRSVICITTDKVYKNKERSKKRKSHFN